MTALPVTVVETQAFIAAAKDCLAEEERFDAITMIANNPEYGDLIPGGGGIRKVRFARTDLSRAELNLLAKAAKTLARTYGV